MFQDIGRQLAEVDRYRAQQALYQLPQSLHLPWVTGIMRSVAIDEPDVAKAWLMNFPAGELRDAALQEFLRLQSYGGAVDTYLFASFSDRDLRDDAALRVAQQFSFDGNPAGACRIASSFIASAALRNEAREQFESCRLD